MLLALSLGTIAALVVVSYLLLSAKIAAIGSPLSESVAAVSRLQKQISDEGFKLRLAVDAMTAERVKANLAAEEVAFYRARNQELQAAVIGLADRKVQAAAVRTTQPEEKAVDPGPSRWSRAAGLANTTLTFPGANVLQPRDDEDVIR